MKPQLCYESFGAGFGIRLWQTGRDRFSVRYGEQVKTGLDYAQAAKELGECIMHAAALDGKISTRE